MKYFLYVIQSEKDNTFYIGATGNIEKRIIFHNCGLQRYTKRKIPWKIIYTEEFNSKSEALRREKELKRKKSRKYIEWFVRNHRGVVPTNVGTSGS